MGRVFSVMSRELKNYNVEDRAHKVISKEYIRPSPKYPSTIEQIKIVKDKGITVEELSKKHEELHDNLKDIYVVSGGNLPTTDPKNPLPLDRIKDWSSLKYGYLEPEVVPEGKITLKRLLDMLSKSTDSNVTSKELATHYNISVELVDKLMDRYAVFELHVEENEEKTKKMSWAERVQLKSSLDNIRQLTVISDKRTAESKPVVPAEVKPT